MFTIATAIAILLSNGRLTLLLFILKRCRHHQKKILVASVIITSLLFWYDYTHDDIRQDMTIVEHIMELVLAGTIYITIISLLIYGIRLIIKRCSK